MRLKNITQEDALSRRIALTNGCFDLVHSGHLYSLKRMRETLKKITGDYERVEIWVAINSDESVRELKGPDRPILPEEDRRLLVESMFPVKRAFVFDGSTVDEVIRWIKPVIWFKSGYETNTLNVLEVQAANEVGCAVICTPAIEGHSTTSLIARIRSQADKREPVA